MTDRRRFLAYTGLALVTAVSPDAFASKGRTKPKPAPTPKGSSVVRASTASGGHMNKHFNRPASYARNRVKTKDARLLFNTVSKGGTPSGGKPNKVVAKKLENAYYGSHINKGHSPKVAKEMTRQSMGKLNAQVKHLKSFRSKPTRVSMVTQNAKSFDRMVNAALKNPANRKLLADGRKSTAKHPKRTVAVPIKSSKDIGYVYKAKPGQKGKYLAASARNLHVGFTRKGVPFVHMVKLNEKV